MKSVTRLRDTWAGGVPWSLFQHHGMGYLACEVTLGGTLGPRSCDRQQGWEGVCSIDEEAPQPTPPVACWRTTSWKGLGLGEARANELSQEGLAAF